MADSYHYAGRWIRLLKEASRARDADQARQAHEARTLYTVLVGDGTRPSAFLEVNGGFVGVGFLDAHLREYLSYGFREVEPGKLFLEQSTHREFVGDSDKTSTGTIYLFKPDGRLRIRREQFEPHKVEVAESSADVQGNYDTYPQFGSYGHLLRKERGACG